MFDYTYREKIETIFNDIAADITEEKIKQFQDSQLGKSCSRTIVAYIIMGEVDNFDEEYPEGIDPMIVINKIVDAMGYYSNDYDDLVSR